MGLLTETPLGQLPTPPGEWERDGAAPAPPLGVFLRLPPPLQQRFRSANQRTLLVLDFWGIISSVLVNVVINATVRNKGNVIEDNVMLAIFLTTWLLAMGHGWLIARRPALYMRVRNHVALMQRIHRMLVILTLGTRASWRVVLATAEEASQDWRLYLYMTSLVSILSFFNTLNYVLPFTLQLPMALLKMCVDVFVFSPTVAAALRHPSSTLGAYSTSACEASLLAVTRLCGLVHPVGLGGAREVACRDPVSSGVAFSLFMAMFTGNVLPAFISYVSERAIKVRFLALHGYDTEALQPGVLGSLMLLYICIVACALLAALLVQLPLFGG